MLLLTVRHPSPLSRDVYQALDHARRHRLHLAVAANDVPGIGFRLQQAGHHVNVPYGDSACLMLEANELLIVRGKGVRELLPPALLRRILGKSKKELAARPGDLVVIRQPLTLPRLHPGLGPLVSTDLAG